MEWQSMESAPRDGTRVLAAWKGSQDFEFVFWSDRREAWCASDGGWGTDRWRGDDSPTHWMQIPKAPE